MVLVIKLFGAPLLIGAISLLGKRFGAAAAGVFSGLPIIGGPILWVLWREQGAAYTAQVAAMLPVGLSSMALYIWVFSRLARQTHWAICLSLGWVAFLLSAWVLQHVPMPYGALLALALASMVWVGYSLPRAAASSTPIALPHSEVLTRMTAAFALVLVLTQFTTWLGAEWTGLLTAFPVAGSVIPSFTLANNGALPTLRLLRGFVSGLLGLGGFSLVLSITLPLWGGWAFGLAVVVSVLLAWAFSRWIFRA